MSAKDSERHCGSAGGRKFFFFLSFSFSTLPPHRGGRVDEEEWAFQRRWGIVTDTHICTRTSLHPRWLHERGEISHVSDFRGDGRRDVFCPAGLWPWLWWCNSNSSSRRLLELTMDVSSPSIWSSSTCPCVAIRGLGGGGVNLCSFSISGGDADGSWARNKFCRAKCISWEKYLFLILAINHVRRTENKKQLSTVLLTVIEAPKIL